MNFNYRLYCPGEPGDDTPKKYTSENAVQAGDVIAPPDSTLFYVVYQVTPQKTGTRLTLSSSGQSRQDALLLAEQKGHWPTRPPSARRRA